MLKINNNLGGKKKVEEKIQQQNKFLYCWRKMEKHEWNRFWWCSKLRKMTGVPWCGQTGDSAAEPIPSILYSPESRRLFWKNPSTYIPSHVALTYSTRYNGKIEGSRKYCTEWRSDRKERVSKTVRLPGEKKNQKPNESGQKIPSRKF